MQVVNNTPSLSPSNIYYNILPTRSGFVSSTSTGVHEEEHMCGGTHRIITTYKNNYHYNSCESFYKLTILCIQLYTAVYKPCTPLCGCALNTLYMQSHKLGSQYTVSHSRIAP